MNKKIAKTLLILIIVYLSAFYVIKFIYPQFLLEQLVDPNVLKLGTFVESNIYVLYAFRIITTFITFYLFVCASSGRFRLRLREFIFIIIVSIISIVVTRFLPTLMTHTSTSLMLLLVLICRGKKEYFIPVFIVHGYLSQFTFAIKGFETIIMNINAVNGIMLGIEGWVWLFIFSLVFYLKENRK